MNILFTPSDNNRISGAFLCMVTLIDILQKAYGHDVLVVLPCEGNGKELLDEHGIRNVTVRSYTWTTPIEDKDKPIAVLKDTVKAIISRKNVVLIKRLIRENDIDIVHNNTSWGYVGALAAIETETPLVWHIQEFLEEDQARTIRWQSFGYRLMARSDMALAISESIYEKYRPIIGEDRLRLVLDGIEADKYECQDHELFVDKKVHFLMVGGGKGKGHRVAIEALMKLIAQGYDDFELVVLGRISQDYEVDLQQLFAGDALATRHFIFPGSTDDVTSYYRSSDIFLMCSRAEAFGRVTVEAMMGGCLVIGGALLAQRSSLTMAGPGTCSRAVIRTIWPKK